MASQTQFDASGGMRVYKWTLGAGENGGAFEASGLADRSVQVTGSFFGTTVVVQGSNEKVPSNWFTMHDSAGSALTFTAAGGDAVMENCLHVRVITTGGDDGGTTAVVVHMSARN